MERPEVEEARVAGAEWTQERSRGCGQREQGKVWGLGGSQEDFTCMRPELCLDSEERVREVIWVQTRSLNWG